jgi:ubiquinol-cytochrome c reductase cytochrome c1 subunit
MIRLFALFALLLSLSHPVLAAGSKIEYPEMEWHHAGMFGTFDRAQLQRGFQVYKQVCAACHSMRQLSYRNLSALGYDEGQIKAIAAEYQVTDGPNDAGEMFERAARPSDKFKSPFVNEQAARAANNGAYPKDLSLITKARHGGADYLHALLTGYVAPPEGFEVPDGMYYNKYYEGHLIAMAPPLLEGVVSYADGTEASVEQMSQDVSAFLTWAAEPEMETRKKMGLQVLIFLAVFSVIMYLVKKEVWKNVKD